MVYNGNPYFNGWFGGTTIFGNTHWSLTLPMANWSNWVVATPIFCYFHPLKLVKMNPFWIILTNIFQWGWFNHQLAHLLNFWGYADMPYFVGKDKVDFFFFLMALWLSKMCLGRGNRESLLLIEPSVENNINMSQTWWCLAKNVKCSK